MIKASRNLNEDFPLFHLFEGNSRAAANAQYLFKESEYLFGLENLAFNLIEYTESEDEALAFLKGDVSPLIDPKIVPADIRPRFFKSKIVGDLDKEMVIEYFDGSLTDKMVAAARLVFGQYLRLGFEILKRDTLKSEFSSVVFKEAYCAQILISESFVKNGCKSLSERFQPGFSKDRFVDSQIPFYLVGSWMAGMKSKT